MPTAIEVHLVQAPGAQERSLDLRRMQAGILPQGSMLVVGRSGNPCSPDLIRFAAEAMASDPRIATVSNCDSALAELSAVRGRIRLASPVLEGSGTALASAPAGSHVLLNVAAFDLVGYPELASCQGSGVLEEILRWSAVANHRGLRHCWRWSGGTSESPSTLPASQLEVCEAADSAAPIGYLVDRHRAAYDALTVSVDASWLGPNETGAQVATVHWLAALAQRTDIAELRLHNLPDGRLPSYASHLASYPCIRLPGVADNGPTDIHWRPYQPDHRTSASRDRLLGKRLVTTVLDLIDHSNERYHSDTENWAARRKSMRTYLTGVDMVTTISKDVAAHVLSEIPGLDPERVRETALGVDHLLSAKVAAPPPDLVEAWPGAADSRFLLVLGNDFMHKNRDFAIRVWLAVSEEEPIDLVLAGLHVRDSSTKTAEDVLLAGPRHSQSLALRLEHVSQAAKTWLLANAAVVLYPSSAEGFGFIPHEAATLGANSLATSFGPLREFLPEDVLTHGWSLNEYRQRTMELLRDETLRRARTQQILTGVQTLTWRASACELAATFRSALALPPRSHDRTGGVGPSGIELGDEAAALASVMNSLSWRVTRPLRSTAEGARLVKRRLRA